MISTGSVKGWSQEQVHPDGERIFSEGDPSESVHFIIEGKVEISREEAGTREVLGILSEGQIFGELGVIRGIERQATVRALGEVRTLIIEPCRFLDLAAKSPQFSDHLHALRRIYRDGRGGPALQFEGFVDGEPAIISSLTCPDGRQLSVQFRLRSVLVDAGDDTETDEFDALEFEDLHRNIRRAIHLRDGVPFKATILGPSPETGQIIAAIRDQLSLTPDQAEHFRNSGLLFTAAVDTEIVCHCLMVARTTLEKQVAAGCRDATSLANATGVSTICGGCRGEVEAIVGDPLADEARIEDRVEIAPDTWRIRFTPEDGNALLPSIPGQHILIEGTIDGLPVRRPYTLTSSGEETRWREITIRREDHGLFSRWLSEVDPEAAKIRIGTPSGNFVANLQDPTPIHLLVAGIGVTPALAIARSRSLLKSGPTIEIDHSARTDEHLVARDEFLSHALETEGLNYLGRRTVGGERIRLQDIAKLHQKNPQARWMICGPQEFEEEIMSHLAAVGVATANVHTEQFLPRKSKPGERVLPDRFSLVAGLVTAAFAAIVLLAELLPEAVRLWQGTSLGRWISGGLLVAYLASQWILPMVRWSRRLSGSNSILRWHRRIGAFSPLLLVLHGYSAGIGLLALITGVFLLNSIVGVADRTIFADPALQTRYLRFWLFPHLILSILLTTLATYHVWIILSHGGP